MVDIKYLPSSSKVFLEGNSYIVFIDVIIDGELASYVLHCEGNPRVIFKLVKENWDKLHQHKYYMLKHLSILGKNSECIVDDETIGQLYRFKGDL